MGITANGYETTPVAKIKSDVQKLFTDALGDDLDLSDETPQGNLINGITDMVHQIDMHRQSDFYARDIYKAVGLQLDILGRELGIPRKSSVPTQILVSVQGAVNYTIKSGTIATITTDNSKLFEFTSAVELSSSTVSTTLTATEGSVYKNLSVGQQLQTQEYTPQIYDITITSITYGKEAESDYMYRLRLLDAKSATTDEVEHFTLELENINNVLSAYVEANNTLSTSPSGIPAHSVEIVVLGGSENDIGDVIMHNIFATPTYQDPVLGEEIQVEDYNGHTQTFYITRPEMKEVTVLIEYEDKPGQTLSTNDMNAIKAKLLEFINTIYMNKSLYISDLYNLAIEDYAEVYAIKSITVEVDGSAITNSYTCSTREYLYCETVTFDNGES